MKSRRDMPNVCGAKHCEHSDVKSSGGFIFYNMFTTEEDSHFD